jgi:hypothetical protein
MKKLGLLALVGFAVAISNAKAGSAVVMENAHGKMVSSYGHPKAIAKQRALEQARKMYGPNVRLLAASDVTGYCAVAVARLGKSSVIGVALGKRSATEANIRAIAHCVNAGGVQPRVISAWRG